MEKRVFAIEASKIIELVSAGEFTRLPKAPKEVVGLMSLRGSSLLVLDTGVLMGQHSTTDTSKAYVIITPYQNSKIGWLVSEVLGVTSKDNSLIVIDIDELIKR